MQCVYPKNIIFKDKVLTVPCGKCIGCRIAKSREWSIRLMHEKSYHDKSSFVTLTFDDEHLPENGSISKRDLQTFFKRLRKEVKFKYFACGEYGEKNKRPHYHAIMFDVGIDDKELIQEKWGNGLIDVGTVTYDSCRYVSDYIFKQYDGEYKDIYFKDKEVPFRICSQGLGATWAIDNIETMQQHGYITHKGIKHSIPVYYKRLLNMEKLTYDEQKQLNEDMNSEMIMYHDKGLIMDQVYEQKELNMVGKNAIKKARKLDA